MTIKELEDAQTLEQLVYAVDPHVFTIPDKKNKKNNIEYTMPIVIKTYIEKIDIIGNKIHCAFPTDNKSLKRCTASIDYGKRRPEKLYITKEQAEALITPDLIKQYISQDFVNQHPEILDKHPILKDVFDVPEKNAEDN